jgi:hypothetical protein
MGLVGIDGPVVYDTKFFKRGIDDILDFLCNFLQFFYFSFEQFKLLFFCYVFAEIDGFALLTSSQHLVDVFGEIIDGSRDIFNVIDGIILFDELSLGL